ncbi:MAG: tetratricopeptide repeat protein [Bacteroidales bacterium]|jgi:serine phosphatase RsbU (regulator of sigma subunit)|nr:tetratricopeptide repeat protein [Bacteroidales bacterium]
MNGKKYILLFFYAFLSVIVQGQISEQTDSLKNPNSYLQVQADIQAAQRSIAQQNEDSTLFYYNSALESAQNAEFLFLEAHVLYNIGKVFLMLQQKDTAVVVFSRAADIWRKNENYYELNKTLTNISSILQEKGASLKGLQISQEAIDAAQKADYERGEGIAYLLRGNFLYSVARYEEALEHFLAASDIFQNINFKAGVGMCYNSIANIYNTLEQHDRALDYYTRNYELQKETGNRLEEANSALNIGTYYIGIKGNNFDEFTERRNVDSMFQYLNIAIDTYEQLQNPMGIIQASTNLGLSYLYMKNPDYEKSREFLLRAQKLAQRNDIPSEIARAKRNMALLHTRMGKYEMAIAAFNEAYNLFVELHLTEDELMLYKRISEVYAAQNEYQTAYSYLRKYDKMEDSLRQRESQRLIDQLSIRYESELKDQQIASAKVREKDLRDRNFVQERFNLVLKIAIGAIAIFLVLVFYQFLQKRKANKLLTSRNIEITKQKEEIELQRNRVLEQKDIIEEQQQNIIDSIHYASRIQEAILPQKETISEIFNDNLFVLFKPRDIVSGDFYWIGKKFDKHIFMASDCTGHGVPGAFMSMLGTAFLNDIIVGESDTVSSYEILNTLREYVITSLRQTGKEGEQKDGMDVALCMYDEKTKIVDFAGANNPLVVVREGEIENDFETSRIKLQTFVSASNSKTYSIIQAQGDKMPIGIYDNQKPFVSVSLQLQEGDTLYVFSDGYQDQFGGEKNKKFMIKRLKQLFVDINGFDVHSQHNLLDKTLDNWMKQSDAEQVDDILVIGFKVS